MIKKLTQEQIKQIEELTKFKYSLKSGYFYGWTGSGFRRASWRLYVDGWIDTNDKVFQNSPFLWNQLSPFNQIVMICLNGMMSFEKENGNYKDKAVPWAVPIKWLIPLGKILEEAKEANNAKR